MTRTAAYVRRPSFAALVLGVAAFLLLGGLAWTPAQAADLSSQSRLTKQTGFSRVLPFARSERAQSVWASGACWTECGSYCTWGLAGCLERDAQGQCLKLADSCDRYCQRDCRTSGGPLLPLDF